MCVATYVKVKRKGKGDIGKLMADRGWRGLGAKPGKFLLQSWTKYIETTTKIQVELMNPQLRLRIGIF